MKHGVGIFFFPPGSWQFETFLNEKAVSAFNLARTDGEFIGQGLVIIELSWTIFNIPQNGSDGSISVGS